MYRKAANKVSRQVRMEVPKQETHPANSSIRDCRPYLAHLLPPVSLQETSFSLQVGRPALLGLLASCPSRLCAWPDYLRSCNPVEISNKNRLISTIKFQAMRLCAVAVTSQTVDLCCICLQEGDCVFYQAPDTLSLITL